MGFVDSRVPQLCRRSASLKKILYINPVEGEHAELDAYLQEVKGPDTELTVGVLERAPRHFEYYYCLLA